jgi:predicted MFS family arabinose efflux permease
MNVASTPEGDGMTKRGALARPRGEQRWGTILTIVACGVVAALQVGKAAIAAPALQSDLGLDLAQIGAVAGIFSVLGFVGSIPAGLVIATTTARSVLLWGLLAIALGAGAGAVAPSFPVLLATRVLEGLGFLLVTVAGPTLLERSVEARMRDVTLALWSCFMPIGIALALLTGPLFGGWRAMWWASAAMAILLLGLAGLIEPGTAARSSSGRAALVGGIATLVRRRGPAVLAICFVLYNVMFFALFSFLPILLMQRLAVSNESAGMLSALAAAANIIGNLAAGQLLARGMSRARLIAVASLAMGAFAVGIFLPILEGHWALLLCVAFSAVGGIIPAALLSAAPIASTSATLVPVMMGLLMAGSNLGQMIGPVAVGAAVEAWGWSGAGIIVIVSAIAASLAAGALSLSDHKAPQP